MLSTRWVVALAALYLIYRLMVRLERDDRQRRRLARQRLIAQKRFARAQPGPAPIVLEVRSPATVYVRGSVDVRPLEPVDAMVIRKLRETRALCPPAPLMLSSGDVAWRQE